MGNQQPKKLGKAPKAQIEMASLKAKIHLELVRDRKNAEIIRGQKELVTRIKSPNRNRTEELLLIQRIVNGLKYTQASNQLMAYAATLRPQADFISKNMMYEDKMAPWLTPIYTLIYASDLMGLSSLNQFKSLMRSLNDPQIVGKYVNQQVIQLLTPKPSHEQLNIYILEMIERNNLSLEQVNTVGHKFTKDLGRAPDSQDNSFDDFQKQLAQQMKKNIQGGNQKPDPSSVSFGDKGNPGQLGQGGLGGQEGQGGQGGYGQGGLGGYGQGQGGYGQGQGGYGQGQGGYGQGQGGYGQGNTNPPGTNYYDMDKNIPVPISVKNSNMSSQSSNPYGIRESYDPRNPQVGERDHKVNFNEGNSDPRDSRPNEFQQSRISVNDIKDIDFFPQITPVIVKDPKFDQICQILQAAM